MKKKGKLPARIFSLAMWEVYDHKSSEVFPFVCRFSKVREICWSCITDLVIGLYKTLVGHNFNCFFSLTLSCHFSFTHSHTPLEMTVAICRVIITCYNSLHIDFTKYWHENLLINSWQLLMVPCRKKKTSEASGKKICKSYKGGFAFNYFVLKPVKNHFSVFMRNIYIDGGKY